MSFGAPSFLYLLFLLPLGLLILWMIRRQIESVRGQFAMRRLSEVSRPRGRFSAIRLALMFLLGSSALILALAQPRLEHPTSKPLYRKINVVFILDVSLSMRARDITPSRLQRASKEIRSLILESSSDIGQIGLVSFSGSSTILSYLTRDPSNILFYLDYLEGDPLRKLGTDIGAALRNALLLIDKEQSLENSLRASDFVLILISDGEDHGGLLRQGVQSCVERGLRIYSLGLGSKLGGFIPIGERRGETIFLTNEQGQRVLATFDETALREIAEMTGGRYYRSYSGNELARNLSEILASEREVIEVETVIEEEPVYSWFILLGFIGLAVFLVD